MRRVPLPLGSPAECRVVVANLVGWYVFCLQRRPETFIFTVSFWGFSIPFCLISGFITFGESQLVFHRPSWWPWLRRACRCCCWHLLVLCLDNTSERSEPRQIFRRSLQRRLPPGEPRPKFSLSRESANSPQSRSDLEWQWYIHSSTSSGVFIFLKFNIPISLTQS